MDQQQGQEQILISPQNLESNNSQECSQKNEFLEQKLKAKVNEDLIQWMIAQLNQAKTLCSELIRENVVLDYNLRVKIKKHTQRIQCTQLKIYQKERKLLKLIKKMIQQLYQILYNFQIQIRNINKCCISSNSVSQESYYNQGTSISNQDNFLTTIIQVSDMNKQIAFLNEAIRHSSQEDDLLELQKVSEQFKHSEQFSEYYQMHNHQQQQKQIQQIMSQEEDQQSATSHRINEVLIESKFVKLRAMAKQIYNFNSEFKELQEKAKQLDKQGFSDQIQQAAQLFESLIKKYEDNQQEIQQKVNQELEQQQQIESIAQDNSKLDQLKNQYLTKIQEYFQNLNLKGNEVQEKIKIFVENQFHTFSKGVKKLLTLQSKIINTEKDKQIQQLKQIHLIEINQKDQEIIDLNNKYIETQEYLNLSAYNDNNIYSKITQINELLQKTFLTINSTTQKLEFNNLEEMISQIKQINQTFTGETQDDINNLKDQLNQREQIIEQLEKQKQNYENQIKKHNQSAILEKKIEEFQSKYNQQFNQADQIYQKTSKIEEIREELRILNTYIQGDQENLRKKYEDEKNNAIQTQLEGSFKLQDRSLLYIQLGLKIFQQYYTSQFQNNEKIKTQTEKLIKFHENYKKKEYFKLTDLQQIQQYYINQERELKALFDDSFNEYKRFIAEITKGRYQ